MLYRALMKIEEVLSVPENVHCWRGRTELLEGQLDDTVDKPPSFQESLCLSIIQQLPFLQATYI